MIQWLRLLDYNVPLLFLNKNNLTHQRFDSSLMRKIKNYWHLSFFVSCLIIHRVFSNVCQCGISFFFFIQGTFQQ